MKILLFSTCDYDREYFLRHNEEFGFIIDFENASLSEGTVNCTKGYDVVCIFVNDIVDKSILDALKENKVGLIALRCAGFNNVDIEHASKIGLPVVRVPAYSPHAVAEHVIALILTLNRKTHLAYNRVRQCDFTIDGLSGFDLFNKTAGVIGTGKIGTELVKILNGFGMHVLAYDPAPNAICHDAGAEYVEIDQLLAQSDIISLHVPLTDNTEHLINTETIRKMKAGVMLINTSRGAVLDTRAVLCALDTGEIGYLGIDVYEHEKGLFFKDCTGKDIKDDCLKALLKNDNVLVTSHQAFFTKEALTNIAVTTLRSISDLSSGIPLEHDLTTY